MKKDELELKELIEKLRGVIDNARQMENRYEKRLSKVRSEWQRSAQNMIHYLALRHSNLREAQHRLANLGLSSMGRAENHVLATVNAVYSVLHKLAGMPVPKTEESVGFYEGRQIMKHNATRLMGESPANRRPRILLTMPSEAAENPDLVEESIRHGIDCFRVNCSHDGEDDWKNMFGHIRNASKKTGKDCKILVDLGGPKIRTGPLKKGPESKYIKPKKDKKDKPVSPAIVLFSTRDHKPKGADVLVPVEQDFIEKIKIGDQIVVKTSEGKKRKIEVTSIGFDAAYGEVWKGTNIDSGMPLKLRRKGKIVAKGHVGKINATEIPIRLNRGDTLVVHQEQREGSSARYDETGKLIEPANISCTFPEIFDKVKPEERILFDDGEIEGVIKEVHDSYFMVKITFAKTGGSKLKSDKGINLPESDLQISGLTKKDRKDLSFAIKHADIISMSFINSENDVFELLKEINKYDRKEVGIVLKIETKKAYKNLPSILLASMQHFPAGVMIARGDLAVECGWAQLAEIQEDILWLCESAHMPMIWATQVLETLAKKGLPSRAEITDAAMAERAECVMLNKGEHIIEAIQMLDTILTTMKDMQHKKSAIMSSKQDDFHYDLGL